jgi:hypothetical protein
MRTPSKRKSRVIPQKTQEEERTKPEPVVLLAAVRLLKAIGVINERNEQSKH